MSFRKAFKTDKRLETEGLEVNYGTTVITVCRAGKKNKAYQRALARGLKPHQASLQAGAADEAAMQKVVIRAFCDHVIRDWRTVVDGGLQQGIEPENEGDPLIPFTADNAYEVLVQDEFHDMVEDLLEKAMNRKLFLEDMEEAAKN